MPTLLQQRRMEFDISAHHRTFVQLSADHSTATRITSGLYWCTAAVFGVVCNGQYQVVQFKVQSMESAGAFAVGVLPKSVDLTQYTGLPGHGTVPQGRCLKGNGNLWYNGTRKDTALRFEVGSVVLVELDRRVRPY